MQDRELAYGECGRVSKAVAAFIPGSKLIYGCGFRGVLDRPATGYQGHVKWLGHVVVLLADGETVIDATYRQFGRAYPGPKYTLADFKRHWRHVVLELPMETISNKWLRRNVGLLETYTIHKDPKTGTT